MLAEWEPDERDTSPLPRIVDVIVDWTFLLSLFAALVISFGGICLFLGRWYFTGRPW